MMQAPYIPLDEVIYDNLPMGNVVFITYTDYHSRTDFMYLSRCAEISLYSDQRRYVTAKCSRAEVPAELEMLVFNFSKGEPWITLQNKQRTTFVEDAE